MEKKDILKIIFLKILPSIIAFVFIVLWLNSRNELKKIRISGFNFVGINFNILDELSEQEKFDEFLTILKNNNNPKIWKDLSYILNEKYGYYHFTDEELSYRLENEFIIESNDMMTKSLEEICDTYQDLLNENQLICRLRELSKEQKPPFQIIGQKAVISIPAKKDQPPPNMVYVARNGNFDNKRIKIINPIDENKYAVLDAVPSFDLNIAGSDIQINEFQAEAIFKDRNSWKMIAIVVAKNGSEEIYDPGVYEGSKEYEVNNKGNYNNNLKDNEIEIESTENEIN